MSPALAPNALDIIAPGRLAVKAKARWLSIAEIKLGIARKGRAG